MRIVFVINSLIYGGAETQLLALSRELSRRGRAVSVFILSANNPRLSELSGSGVTANIAPKRLKLDPQVIWRLRKHLKDFRADIVHGFLFDGNIYACIAALGSGIPALGSERSDNYSLNSNQRRAISVSRHMVSGVVANTHAGAEFARQLFQLSPDRFHVVWNGIDIDALSIKLRICAMNYKHEFFGGDNIKLACLAGNIRRAKDFHLALRVADRLTRDNPNWRFLFVGGPTRDEPDYYNNIMTLWRELGLQDRAKFVGLREDTPEILSQCDVMLSTSTYEGFPNVVLEAMTVGTPVISTNYSDICMILPEPWQIVSRRDPADIATTILRADRERLALVEKQRTWVAQNATISHAADRLEQVYLHYLASHNRPSPWLQRRRK